MPTKISALPAASALAGTETVPLVQSNTTKGGLISQIGTYVRGLFTATPATVAEGGTGAATVATARTSLGAVSLAGDTMTGKLIFKAGLNSIASAATVDLTVAGAGNTVHITGATGIGAWTMNSGQVVDVVFDGAPLLTHSATTFNLPGGANISAGVGDRSRLWYDGTTVWCVEYVRAAANPLVAPGTSGNVLTSNGSAWASTAPVVGTAITLGTPVASTSGVSIDFTGIPSTAKLVMVNFKSISTNGTSQYLIQIGKSGGVETAGYTGGVGDRVGDGTSAAGYEIHRSPGAGSLYSGSCILALESVANNTWTQLGILSLESSGIPNFSAGVKSLAGVLDRVRITTVGGANTFSNGEINISWE